MKNLFFFPFLIFALFFVFCQERPQVESENYTFSTFHFTKEVVLPDSPEAIYDAVTGDISGWWDHTFSENPQKLYIEAKPGGGFWEIFDENGNGVLHAQVIYAERGKLLRLNGPLGLSGHAINLVCTFQFDSVATESTNLKLDVHASGEMKREWPAIVEDVWQHFLFDQLKPYIESGRHLDLEETKSSENQNSP